MRQDPTIPSTCQFCGAAFLAPRGNVERGWGRFCSLSCAAKARFLPLAERLWSGLDRSGGPDACWLWQGYRKVDGYGGIGSNKKLLSCHRLAWELTNGPIPDGLAVLHRCDVPLCCNPAHLWLGTNDDNMADMVAKGRAATGERSGHVTHPERTPRGEQNGKAKLTWPQVREMRALSAAGGWTIDTLAPRYGVNRTTIATILRGETWRE